MVRLDQDNREQYTQDVLNALNRGDIRPFRKLFLELHPTDQADIFISLNEKQRTQTYEFLSPKEFAEIFHGLEVEEQTEFIDEVDHRMAVEMFNNMYADDVADFFGQLPEYQAHAFLNDMQGEYARDVMQLLAYPEETAGAIMTTEFISISVHDTVDQVLAYLRQKGPDAETIYYLYVTDDARKLVGVASLRDLIIASPEANINELMSTRLVSVSATDDQEDVANVLQKYEFLAIPVVDQSGRLIGIVTVDDVMEVIEQETTEDIGEISAARGAVDPDVTSFGAARKRAPWIIILMFLGLITADVIGRFETTLENVVVLAAFIPLIMDSAGNTGTQSLAVIVRGLALGTIEKAGVWRILRREFGTGLMLGLICAIVLCLTIPLPFLYGSFSLAFVVGISLFFSLSIATVIGSIIPLIINRLKIDPAVASGPFITTLNDIIGLLIFFSIATALIDLLPA